MWHILMGTLIDEVPSVTARTQTRSPSSAWRQFLKRIKFPPKIWLCSYSLQAYISQNPTPHYSATTSLHICPNWCSSRMMVVLWPESVFLSAGFNVIYFCTSKSLPSLPPPLSLSQTSPSLPVPAASKTNSSFKMWLHKAYTNTAEHLDKFQSLYAWCITRCKCRNRGKMGGGHGNETKLPLMLINFYPKHKFYISMYLYFISLSVTPPFLHAFSLKRQAMAGGLLLSKQMALNNPATIAWHHPSKDNYCSTSPNAKPDRAIEGDWCKMRPRRVGGGEE